MLSWDVGISAWGKGKGPHALLVPLKNDTIRAGAMVCFESVYPNIVRQFVVDGADFLTIVTNDGWYLGTPGPLQHERYALASALSKHVGALRGQQTRE